MFSPAAALQESAPSNIAPLLRTSPPAEPRPQGNLSLRDFAIVCATSPHNRAVEGTQLCAPVVNDDRALAVSVDDCRAHECWTAAARNACADLDSKQAWIPAFAGMTGSGRLSAAAGIPSCRIPDRQERTPDGALSHLSTPLSSALPKSVSKFDHSHRFFSQTWSTKLHFT